MDNVLAGMQAAEDGSIRAFNMVQIGRALTDRALDPPVRALVVFNSNPAAIAPNQPLVLEGLRREDLFTVVHEHVMTDTALHADFVLPATTEVENLDLFGSWGHTYVTLNRPAIAPVGDALSNADLFRRLAARLGIDDDHLRMTDEQILRAILSRGHRYLNGVSFERLWEEGWARLDLPEDWRPFAEGGFPTPSGKCEFYSESLEQRGLPPLPTYTPPRTDARYPLSLLSAKSALHFLNSSYAGLGRHRRAEGTPVLDVSVADAAARGIADGDLVRVFNDQAEVRLSARVGDRVRPGLVAMPFGWWASLSEGGSANALTSDGLADWGGGGDFYDARVEVARADAPADAPGPASPVPGTG
jgi:anaerobic selenocysteine-containing dehydrogenase